MSKVTLEQAQHLAREVLDRTTPESEIRLAQLNFTSKPPNQAGALDVEASLAMAVHFDDDEQIICMSRYEITAAPDSSTGEHDTDDEAWQALVEVHGVWPLTGKEDFKQSHGQAFALAVGAMALHPYARTYLQAAVAASGYPAFTLSVMHSLMETDSDGLVDLDQVQFLDRYPD